MFLETGFPPDWSTHKKLMWMKAASGGDLPWATFVGNPLQFTAPKAHTLRSVSVAFSPIQSGSGDPSPDNVRPISGWNSLDVYDDPAYGGTIRWNQLIQNGNFGNKGVWSYWQCSYDVADNEATITNTASQGSVFQDINIISGHKYYLTATLKNISGTSISLLFRSSTQGQVTGNDYQTVSIMYTASASASARFQITVAGASGNEGMVKNCFVCDLTEMFGAGNEPATVEAFRELFPKDYYAYDNSYTETCVSAVNGNPWWKTTLSFGTTVYGGTAEVAEDGSVTVTATWSRVDLGSLQWTKSGERFNASIADMQPAVVPPYTNRQTGIICEAYPVDSQSSISSDNMTDKTVLRGTSEIFIKDSSYVSKDSFKTAMNGIYLAYLLNEPVITHLSSVEQLTALAGINTIWSDANGDVTVEARAEAVNNA